MPRKWEPSEDKEPEQVTDLNQARELAQAIHDHRVAEVELRSMVKEKRAEIKTLKALVVRLSEEIYSGQARLI